MKRIHIKISGRVQNVGFRYSIYSLALFYGVKGWVKNLEGNKNKIDKILKFCKGGPLLASVKNVEIKEEDYKGKEKFKILR